MCNARGDSIASFRPEDLAKCYHLEKGTKKLDNKLLVEFNHTSKELCPILYKPDKQFKLRSIGGYSTTMLKDTYQYMVVMLGKLYGDSNASKFPLSYVSLIYYCAYKGSSLNWNDILSTNLIEAITAVIEAPPRTFLSFHMSSYPIYIMSVSHQCPKMVWEWQPTDVTINIYCKVIWEHKYIT
jgi:hypothetical protein